MADPADRPGLRRSTILRATPIIALVGLLPLLLGLFTLTRTVSTPLQRCGSVGAFLLEGRTALRVDPDDPPEGATEAQIRDHRAHPCQERAANRARPAATGIVLGLAIITIAGLTETGIRWSLRARLRRHFDAVHPDRDHPVHPETDPDRPDVGDPGTERTDTGRTDAPDLRG